MPFLSVVIAVLRDAHTLPSTLDSLQAQGDRDLEILVLDPSGKLRDLPRRYPNLLVADRPVACLGEAMNLGLSLAQGQYLHFLHPGDRYLAPDAISYLKEIITAADHPPLAYCAYLQREFEEPPRALTYPLSADWLKKGRAPTMARACWFSREAIVRVGGFNARYRHRPIFDLICRLLQEPTFRATYTRRVLIDRDAKPIPAGEAIEYALETCAILHRNFGPLSALRWFFLQDQFKMLHWGWRFLKQSFVGN